MTQQPLGQAALVIGGGMAGLLAARALSERYVNVTILERDTLPGTCEPRKGVPQGRHAHALLARGQQILEELFPGLTHDLVEQGAVQGRGRFFAGGGYLCQAPHGPRGLFVSRPCLESAVRERVLALSNLRVVEKCAVRGLKMSEDCAQVIGVRVSHRDAGTMHEFVEADLVVDASGRGSQAPAWLEGAGYGKPEVELVEVGMGYSTRLYRRDPGHLNGDVMVNIAPTPGTTRACGMLAQEGDRWIVTLAGYFGDHPPTDEVGFLEFARSLPTLDVYEVIRTATPLSDVTSYRFPANQRRRYEKLARFPDNFLVIGDAVCSFTPIYGQGMTVAALEAQALRACLTAGTRHLAQRFFKRASKPVDSAWGITVGNDARLAGSQSSRTPAARLLNWYMDRLHVAARQDTEVTSAFLRVANLIDEPSTLVRPLIALRVLRGNVRSNRPVANTFASVHVPVSAHDPSGVISGSHVVASR